MGNGVECPFTLFHLCYGRSYKCSLFVPNFPSIWPHLISPLLFLRPQPQCFLLVCVHASVCECVCVTANLTAPMHAIWTGTPVLKSGGSRSTSGWDPLHSKSSALCYFLHPSSLFLPGFRRNEEMRAMEVLPILKEKVAFLSGKINKAAKVNETWSRHLNLYMCTSCLMYHLSCSPLLCLCVSVCWEKHSQTEAQTLNPWPSFTQISAQTGQAQNILWCTQKSIV